MTSAHIEAAVDELIAAAGQYRGNDLRRYPLRMWRAFDSAYPGFAPSWWKDLTVSRTLGGLEFDFTLDTERPWLGSCAVPWARKYLRLHRDHFYIHKLRAAGLFPFADAQDGNWWLFDLFGPDDPEVHFLELGSWNGNVFAADNGLHSPGAKLSEFFIEGARSIRKAGSL